MNSPIGIGNKISCEILFFYIEEKCFRDDGFIK